MGNDKKRKENGIMKKLELTNTERADVVRTREMKAVFGRYIPYTAFGIGLAVFAIFLGLWESANTQPENPLARILFFGGFFFAIGAMIFWIEKGNEAAKRYIDSLKEEQNEEAPPS